MHHWLYFKQQPPASWSQSYNFYSRFLIFIISLKHLFFVICFTGYTLSDNRLRGYRFYKMFSNRFCCFCLYVCTLSGCQCLPCAYFLRKNYFRARLAASSVTFPKGKRMHRWSPLKGWCVDVTSHKTGSEFAELSQYIFIATSSSRQEMCFSPGENGQL